MDLLTTAKNIADRVEAESFKQDVPVAVCVIDIHGNIVLTHRMTGAPAFSLELSERKAYTSALVGMRTADLVPLVQPGAASTPPHRLRRSVLRDGRRRAAHQRRPCHRRRWSQRRNDGAGYFHRRSGDEIDRSYGHVACAVSVDRHSHRDALRRRRCPAATTASARLAATVDTTRATSLAACDREGPGRAAPGR